MEESVSPSRPSHALMLLLYRWPSFSLSLAGRLGSPPEGPVAAQCRNAFAVEMGGCQCCYNLLGRRWGGRSGDFVVGLANVWVALAPLACPCPSHLTQRSLRFHHSPDRGLPSPSQYPLLPLWLSSPVPGVLDRTFRDKVATGVRSTHCR